MQVDSVPVFLCSFLEASLKEDTPENVAKV